MRCKHCAVGPDQDAPRQQLDSEQTKLVLTRLANSGTKYITILGGEATAYRPDLAELLDHAASVGLEVHINSNLLVYDFVEPLLSKPALKAFIVSLDGASPETHDAMRGRGSFDKTTKNIQRITQTTRFTAGELAVEVAFVMSQLNLSDSAKMVPLVESLGANRLNVKNVKLIGRANNFKNVLSITYREMLDAYSALVITWMLSQKIALEVYAPPAFALYLNRRFNLNFPIDGHPACGGITEFGYVDLYGNHLPCPQMSFEEDPVNGANGRNAEINLLEQDANTVRKSALFSNFEKRRTDRFYRSEMHPCKYCRFNAICAPCTADIIKGSTEGEVEICSAVLTHGNEDVPNLVENLFPFLPTAGNN